MNPRLAIKKPAWAYLGLAIVVLVQTTGCKPKGSSDTVAQAIVVGNSMAPHFFGENQSVICSDCQFKIVSEIVDPAQHPIICPNCGTRVATNAQIQTQPADEVSLNIGQLPERWQAIGFQRANDDRALIKRVIGLPGERVWFEHGNVLVQDEYGHAKLLKKNWRQQRATRILVHDNQFQNSAPRWTTLETTSPLITNLPIDFKSDDRRWFSYQPQRCYSHSADQVWSPRIEDSLGFNQTVSRQLNPVNEVCLEFVLDPDLDKLASRGLYKSSSGAVLESELLIAIVVGRQTHLARFIFASDSVDVQLFDGGDQPLASARCSIAGGPTTCGVSNIDQQIIVTVGDQPVVSMDLSSQESAASVEVLLALQPSTNAALKRLTLWRDSYYFSPVSREELLKRQTTSGPAAKTGYFVVGDNQPVSRDSRQWLLPKVKSQDILGTVDLENR